MKQSLKNLSNEELRRLLHAENFKFTQGIDKGVPFNTLKEIRQNIRNIHNELENRNHAPQSANHNHSNN